MDAQQQQPVAASTAGAPVVQMLGNSSHLEQQQQPQQGAAADQPASPRDMTPRANSSAAANAAPASPLEGSGSGSRKRAGSYTTSHPNDPQAASTELLDKLALYVEQLGGKLGEGWKCDVKIVTVSESGETGTCNATYTTPGGKRMRSRGEVAKFLGLDAAQQQHRAGRLFSSGGATVAGAGAATAAAGSSGHGKAPGHEQSAELTAQANLPVAATAAGQDSQAAFGSISKAQAYAAAVDRAKQLKQDGVQLPLQLRNGVVVEDLGVVDTRPAFNTPLSLITPGYRAVFEDPAIGKFVSEIKAQQGVNYPQFVVSLVPEQQQLQALADAGSEQAPATKLVGLGADKQQARQQQVDSSNVAGGRNKAGSFQLACARNADIAWTQVVALQERARLQVEAAAAAGNSLQQHPSSEVAGTAAAASPAPHTDAALDPVLAQLLAKAGTLKGCWGKAMFGLSDADVLQLIEALPGADTTSSYQFVDERGGWDKERELLAKGRWAKRSTLQAGARRSPGAKKQQDPEAAAAGEGGSSNPAALTAVSSKKRPHPATVAAAAAAASAGSDSALFGPAAAKRYRAMGKEDRQIAAAVDKVLDKIINKLEVWWVNETAKEARKAEKAEAREAARKAKQAAKAEDGYDPVDKQQGKQQDVPLQDDLLLPGAATSSAPAAAPLLNFLTGKQAQLLLQVWEFACCFGPLLRLQQVPSLQQLEAGLLGVVSHTGTMASSVAQQLAAARAASDAAAGLNQQQQQQQPDEQQGHQQQQVAAQQLSNGTGTDVAQAPAAATATTAAANGRKAASSSSSGLTVTSQQINADAAGAAWVQLHIAILRHLVEDVFSAVSAATFDTDSMKGAALRDLRAATPHVDTTTWPEAARRYLAAAATATFLAQGEPQSSAAGSSAKELDMPGHLRSMEAPDWAQYLCGGLNMPDMVSRVALLPQGSSETAAESLLMLDDAAALTAAELLLKQLTVKASSSQQQPAGQQQQEEDVMEVDDAAEVQPVGMTKQLQEFAGFQTADISQQQQQQQQLLGRRLLQALVGVWGDKPRSSSGARMCFFAQELNAKLGRARGLDLHSVAARLECGLYQTTGELIKALAADVSLACDLWRDAFNTFDMVHEEGFKAADGRLADAVEERLQQLLQEVEKGSDLAAAIGLQLDQSSSPAALPAEADTTATVQQPEAADAAGPGKVPGAAAVQAQSSAEQAGQGNNVSLKVVSTQAMDVDTGNGAMLLHQWQPEEQLEQEQQPPVAELPAVKAEAAAPAAAATVCAAQHQGQGAAADAAATPQQLVSPHLKHKFSQSPELEQPHDPHGLRDPKRPFNPLSGCRVCWRDEDKGRLLLCDGCEDEYHCYCVTPALLEVPEGDWYCPVCCSKQSQQSQPGAHCFTLGPPAAAAGINWQQAQQPVTAAAAANSWDVAAIAQLPVAAESGSRDWDRPGMQYIKELIGTAQRLSAVPYSNWPVEARLQLLVLLCELLAASNPGRQFLEQRMEVKREAKRKIVEARARINKAKKEAADAAKAAREAKKAGGAAGNNVAAGADKGNSAAGAAATGNPEGPGAGKPAAGSKAAKARGKKGAAAAARDSAAIIGKQTRAHGSLEEPFDEEQELRTIAAQQRVMELATARRLCLGQDRFKNTYWLLGTSELPVSADMQAAGGLAGSAAAAIAEPAAAVTVAKSPAGIVAASKGHKAGFNQQVAVGTYGMIIVQPADLGMHSEFGTQPEPINRSAAAQRRPLSRHSSSNSIAAAAALGSAFGISVAATPPIAAAATEAHAAFLGPLRKVNSKALQQQQQLLQLDIGQPSNNRGSSSSSSRLGVYQTLSELDSLLGWLNPQGARESVLRTALIKVREGMLLFAPSPGNDSANPSRLAEQQQQQPGQQVALSSGRDAEQPAAATANEGKHPRLVLKLKLQQKRKPADSAADTASAANAKHCGTTNCPAADAKHSSSNSSGSQHGLAATAAVSRQELLAAAAAADSDAAVQALHAGLHRFISSIPEQSMHEFWGSSERTAAWIAAVDAASTPSEFAALIGLLDTMLLTDSWRLGWQIWALPAQHPPLVMTWPQVWYRFLGLEASKRPGLPTKNQRDRAQEREWRAQAAARAYGQPVEQQQQHQHKRQLGDQSATAHADNGHIEDPGLEGTAAVKLQKTAQGTPRRSASANTGAAGGRLAGSGGSASFSRTKGRQRQQQPVLVRSGRAAAAKAAAAITEQSRGLTASSTGRHVVDPDYESDLENTSDTDRDPADMQADGIDAATAAAIAEAMGRNPRRAAAVAAKAAIASGSGQQQLHKQQSGSRIRVLRGRQQPQRGQQQQRGSGKADQRGNHRSTRQAAASNRGLKQQGSDADSLSKGMNSGSEEAAVSSSSNEEQEPVGNLLAEDWQDVDASSSASSTDNDGYAGNRSGAAGKHNSHNKHESIGSDADSDQAAVKVPTAAVKQAKSAQQAQTAAAQKPAASKTVSSKEAAGSQKQPGKQQQQQPLQQQQDNESSQPALTAAKPHKKRPAGEGAHADGAQQPPKRAKAGSGGTQASESDPAVAGAPSAKRGSVAAAAVAGSDKAPAAAPSSGAAQVAKARPKPPAAPRSQPKSKAEQLQDLLGASTSLRPLHSGPATGQSAKSGSKPAAETGGKAGAGGTAVSKAVIAAGVADDAGKKGPAAGSSIGTPVPGGPGATLTVQVLGSSDCKGSASTGAADGGSGGTAAVDSISGRPLLSPKKMLLERHEKETQRQYLRHADSSKGSIAAAAVADKGSGKGAGVVTVDPKLASKDKVAWSDEDDD